MVAWCELEVGDDRSPMMVVVPILFITVEERAPARIDLAERAAENPFIRTDVSERHAIERRGLHAIEDDLPHPSLGKTCR